MHRVPVTLLTGFLGAGKTTLVNRILSERHGERIAVLVNEFGDVPIDGRLVVRSDEEVVELANGCVCCSIRGDLARAIAKLLRKREALIAAKPFERLLIETSGLASPGPVLQTLVVEPELAESVEARGVVVLAHAALIEAQLGVHPEVEEQLGYGDTIVLNHVDRADEATLTRAEAAIRARNGVAHVVRAERAGVDVHRLFDEHAPRLAESFRAGASSPHVHSEAASSIVLRSRDAIDLAKLKMLLQFLASKRSHELWRVKGILRCAGRPEAVVVQGVYQFLEIGPGEERPPDESVLVVIGRGFDRGEFDRGWAACRA